MPHKTEAIATDLEASNDARPALRVLSWAADVGTCSPEGLNDPPPRATPAQLRAVPVDALRRELDRLLLGRHPQEGLEALQRLGVFEVWLPEVQSMVGFSDGEWRHKDVWKHTKQVVWQSVPRLEVRWGALLHDVGKVKTRSIEPDGQVHFFGHSEVGAAMFRKRIGRRLGFEGALFDRIHFLILYHLRASQYDRGWTDSAVRRFARDMGDGLTDLLDLSRADITTKRPERRKRGLRQISELASRVTTLKAADAKVAPLPKGLGTEIMRHFGLPPSKRIGDLRRQLELAVEAGELEAGQDCAHYIAWMESHRDALALN